MIQFEGLACCHASACAGMRLAARAHGARAVVSTIGQVADAVRLAGVRAARRSVAWRLRKDLSPPDERFLMRRLALGAVLLAGLLFVYGFSPVAAWVGLLGSAAFVVTRRARETEPQPARIEP